MGFKRLKKLLKPAYDRLRIKRTAAFLAERRAKVVKKVNNATLMGDRELFMLYKDKSPRNRYKKRRYKPIKLYNNVTLNENEIISRHMLNSLELSTNEALINKLKYFNDDNLNVTVPLKSELKEHKELKVRKGISSVAMKLFRVTEGIKKARLGTKYRYKPRRSFYRGNGYKFSVGLGKALSIITNKSNLNLNTFLKMPKRSKSKSFKGRIQSKKRKIFFGLRFNPETRYSLYKNKPYLRKKLLNKSYFFNHKKVLHPTPIRSANYSSTSLGG